MTSATRHSVPPPSSPLDRRGFLRTTAGGTLVLGLASLLPAGCADDYPQAARDGVRPRTFSDMEYAVARAAAEALLVGVPVDPGAVARAMDAELAVAGEPMRSDMKKVLGLMQHLTILGGHVHRFTALSPEARRSYLAGWSHSRFALRREAYQALKGFIVYFAYIRDETRGLTGFPGPWPERFDYPARPVDFGEVT